MNTPLSSAALLRLAAVLLALAATSSLPARAMPSFADDEDEVIGYDMIIKELNSAAAAPETNLRGRVNRSPDPLESVLFHGGVGLTSTFARVSLGDRSISMDQRGLQAAFGIDLFSESWMAEGTVRSFGATEYGLSQVSLKEFDLKLYHRSRLAPRLGMRIGAGLSARYLSITASQPGLASAEYTTPASIAALGVEYFLSPGVSVGAEATARNSLIDETADRSSLDATLRLDTHF